MRHLILGSLTLFGVSLSTARAAASGPIYVHNTTGVELRIHHLSYVTPAGQTRTVGGHWTFKPNERSYLLSDKQTLTARSVTMSVRWGAHNTRWRFDDRIADDNRLLAKIDHSLLGPPGTWSGSLAPKSSKSHHFATSSKFQTLVFRLQNRSNAGDVDILVYDSNNKLVAKSTYGKHYDDRCLLHATKQDRYRIVLRTPAGSPAVRFKLTVASIAHGDVLATAAKNEGGKALVGALLVGLLGDEKDKKEFWNETLSGVAKDAIALAVIEGLTHAQKLKPGLDPLSKELTTVMSRLQGGSDRFVSVRRAYLDELHTRIRSACR